MRTRYLVAIGLVATGPVCPAFARAAELHAPGRLLLTGGDAVGAPAALALPDGRVVLAGERELRLVLTRLEPDGSVDRSFGRAGMARPDAGPLDGGPVAVLARGEGGFVVAAGFQKLVLVGITAAGRLDRAYGDDGVVRVPCVGSCGTPVGTPDGGMLIPSRFGPDTTVVRFTPSGRRDPGYGEGGVAVLSGLSNAELTAFPDGSAAVLGQTQTATGSGTRLIKLTPAGVRDPTFNGGTPVEPIAIAEVVSAVRAAPDGSVHLRVSSNAEQRVVRFTPSGERDPAFGGLLPDAPSHPVVCALGTADGGDLFAELRFGSPFVGGFLPEVSFQRVGSDGTVAPRAVVRMTFGGGVLSRPEATTTPDALTGFGLVPRTVVQRPDGSMLVMGEVGVGYVDDAEVDIVGRGTGVTAISPGLAIDRGFGGAATPPTIRLHVPSQRAGTSVRFRVAAPPGAATFKIQAAGRPVTAATYALPGGRQLVRIALTPRATRTLRRAAPGTLRISARFRDLLAVRSATSARAPLRLP